jgi:hypothetical protein
MAVEADLRRDAHRQGDLRAAAALGPAGTS